MDRTKATKLLRETLDKYRLNHWRVKLIADLRSGFMGKCIAAEKTIVLNAHHVDLHPDEEVTETILHEVAHALTPDDKGHGDAWKAKAIELGARPVACGFYSIDPQIVELIRSGHDVSIEVKEETYTVKTPSYKITKHVDKCPTCGKVAKERSSTETTGKEGRIRLIFLECGHIVIKPADSQSAFEKLIFDGDSNCKHEVWNKTVCVDCGAKRLFPFQIEGARALEVADGKLAIFDEMGLGKTIQALAYLYFDRPNRWPFLWVTKSGILFQHLKEIMRVLGPESCPFPMKKGTQEPVKGMNHIISYDLFRRLNLGKLKEAGFKTIVLDECQAVKNPDSARTQAIRRIARDIPHIIPLSGTFWKNRGSEAFVVLNMLDPMKFNSFKYFRENYVETYYDGGREKEGGLKKNFMPLISHIAIRRQRTEVLPELPLINRTEIRVEVPPEAREVYKQEEDALVEEMIAATLEGTENSFKMQQSILQHLVVMRQVVGLAKVPATLEYAQEFLKETDRKLTIFVHHIKVGELIFDAMNKWCAENDFPQPLKLTASMNSEERGQTAWDFNNGSARILIASTLASGEGLNLQSCSDCVMVERQWNPANEEQAEGRFIRIGQTASSVNAMYIHGDETIDTDLNGIVERKRVWFHKSMNKGEMPQWVETDIVRELAAKIMEKRKKRVT